MKKLIFAFIFLIAIGVLLILSKDPRFANILIAKPATTSTEPTSALQEQSASPTLAANEQMVTVTNGGFSPDKLTITIGTKVIWSNTSGTMANVSSDPHPFHTNYPPLNLGDFANGTTVSLTFDKPGTYTYHNHLNPSQKGTIVVQ